GRKRALRLAIHEIDHGKTRRDLRACGTFKPVIDLVLQELAPLVEQIDGDQPFRKKTYHLVTAPTDRRQVAIFIEQPERIDRRNLVALVAQENIRKQRRS